MTRLGRRAFLGLAGTAAFSALTACGSGAAPVYPIAAAERGGFFYEFTQLLADAVVRADPGFRIERLITSGSLQNLTLLRDGGAALAVVLADAAVDDPAGVVALSRIYENYLQVAVPGDSPVTRLEELAGRRVSLGLPGSGLAHSARRILDAVGLDPASVVQEPVALVDLLDALGSGRVDAGFFAGGVPNPLMQPTADRGPRSGIRVLNLAAALVSMRSRYGSVYQTVVVPAGVYGSTAQVETVGVTSLVLAAPTLPDAVADGLVTLMLDHPDELVPPAALGAQYLSPSALPYTFGIPLHPGAVTAYRRHHG